MLKGKIAVVTGGTRGIGYAIVKKYLENGAKVILFGSRQETVDKALASLKEENPEWEVSGACPSLTDAKEVADEIQAIHRKYGKIDILVNSAGVVTKHDFWNTDEKEYDSIMDTNAKGTFFMSQAVGKQMVEKHIQGHILNVTSSSALRPAWTPYQMSKWAVNGLTQGLADMMIPHGIVVNAIAPGPTATPMLAKKEGDSIYEPYTPSHRYAMPEELASLALFMVSGAGNMIVGDTVYMTGGSGTITMHH